MATNAGWQGLERRSGGDRRTMLLDRPEQERRVHERRQGVSGDDRVRSEGDTWGSEAIGSNAAAMGGPMGDGATGEDMGANSRWNAGSNTGSDAGQATGRMGGSATGGDTGAGVGANAGQATAPMGGPATGQNTAASSGSNAGASAGSSAGANSGSGVGSNPEKDPEDWTTGDEPMTGPQRSYLHTLAREAGETVPDKLSKAEASKLIDELQARSGRGANPADGIG